jgi:cobalt-zinc-cadmium efflux system outer membrane protein
LLGAHVGAQPAAPDGPAIGLPEALAKTLAAHPELAAFGYRVDAAEGQLQQAGLAPNPELAATVQDVLGTGIYRRVDSAETTVTLGWVLERGVRQRLVSTAQANVALRTVDAQILELDVAAETARRFLACLAYQSRLRNAQNAVRFAEETAQLVRERVAAGRALDAELARAEAELARAELVQEDYEHELLSAYHRLSAQWGITQPDFSLVSGDAQTLPVVEPIETVLARADQNPELGRFMSQQRLDEAALRLAEARRRPSWVVSTGVRRFERTDDWGLVGGITVPLTLRNRNQGGIAEARANAARTEAEIAVARVQIETELFVLYQELQHNLQLAARLRADVVPRIERALADTRRAYELGRSGYSEWSVVRAELLAANDDLLEAGVDAQRIVIEIERLTGVRVASAAPAQ